MDHCSHQKAAKQKTSGPREGKESDFQSYNIIIFNEIK